MTDALVSTLLVADVLWERLHRVDWAVVFGWILFACILAACWWAIATFLGFVAAVIAA